MAESKTVLATLVKEAQEIRKEMTDIKVTLERNTVSLEEHIRRTAIAEQRIDGLETYNAICPARKEAEAKSYIWSSAKNWSILLGLIVLIVKEFLPSIKSFFTP